MYRNGCVDSTGTYDGSKCTYENGSDGFRQVKVADSDAAKACSEIGARLPTKPEFESLIRRFDYTEHAYGPELTHKGVTEMQNIFGDMWNAFWSSSVDATSGDYANFFNGDRGNGLNGFIGSGSNDNGDRSFKAEVRCVMKE